jgi:hypothetical protein
MRRVPAPGDPPVTLHNAACTYTNIDWRQNDPDSQPRRGDPECAGLTQGS